MTEAPRQGGPAAAWRGGRIWGGALALGVLALVAGANAHLVFVAVASQPDCVAHAKAAGQGGGYSAAKSSC